MLGKIATALGFGKIQLILMAITATIVIGMAITIFFLNKSNNTLHENIGKVEISLAAEKVSFKKAEKRIDEFAGALKKHGDDIQGLHEASIKANKERRRLDDIFAKHDFQYLLNKKPGLILNRVNRGERDSKRMLECAASRSGCGTKGTASSDTAAPQ